VGKGVTVQFGLTMFSMSYLSVNVIIFSAFVAVKHIRTDRFLGGQRPESRKLGTSVCARI